MFSLIADSSQKTTRKQENCLCIIKW